MRQLAFYVSIISWIAAFGIYLASYAGIIFHSFWIWLLHILVILVWLPMLINVKNIIHSADEHFTNKSAKVQSLSMFLYLFKDTPKWFIALLYMGIMVSIESFVSLLMHYRGQTEIIDGQYMLSSLSKTAIEISEGEYVYQQALKWRGHAGHYLLFFGLAASILYKYKGGGYHRIKYR